LPVLGDLRYNYAARPHAGGEPQGRGIARMKNFLRGLRWTWPYRGRMALSLLFALGAAVLWSLNLSAIYPVLRVLENGKSWPDQVEDEIDRLQKEYDRQSVQLERLRLEQKQTETWPDERLRSHRERELAGALARTDSRLSWLSRRIYLQQWLKALLTRFMPPGPFAGLATIFGMLLAAVALKGVFEFFQESLVGSVTNRTMHDLRCRYFRNAIHLDVGHFGDQGSHAMLTQFTTDMEMIAAGIKTLYGRVIAEPLRALACIAAASYISWQLTLLFLILVPAALFTLTKVGRMMKRASRRLLERMSNLYRILQETFRGIRVVKAFTAEAYERQRFREASRDYTRRAIQLIKLDALTSPAIELLGVAAVTAALLAGAYLVLEQRTELFGLKMCDAPLDVATLLQLYALLAAIADPVRKLSSVYTKLQTGAAAADRIFAGIDLRPRVAANGRGEVLPRLAGEVEFRDVCFSYEPGRPTLAHIRLDVRAGETIALVGKNGSGKSTLVGLLPRFYDPDYGSVVIDGYDLRHVHLRSLRRQIGLVTQDTFLFDDTVANNIAYGRRHVRPEAIEAAARQAFAHDFIERLPEGYQTRIGESGAKLSGGQRQRLALARAILRDPTVLILDEFTSQCDAESEALIHQALRQFARNRTTFIVTHRLNTLEIADRIVVLESGQIEAVGSHAELLANCELYRQMHDSQRHRRVA
jgi:ATP-binding cassette subfamily B protein/subfamily B ATP-binding cassette protein MsbA